MLKRTVLAMVALLALASVLPSMAADVIFMYKFEAGTSERYRIKLNQETDFGSGAMGQIADFEVTLKCVSVTDGKAAMEMTFDKVDISREMFGNISSDPVADMVVGKTLAYTVDADGNVSDTAPSPYFDGWEQVQGFLEPLAEGWYMNLPGKPVAVGGSWDHSKQDKGVGGMDVATTEHFTFKEMKKEAGRECALVVGEVETALSGESSNQMGSFAVSGGGKGKFEMFYDTAANKVIKLKGKMDVEAELTPSAGAANAVTANTTYQMERVLL
jgi:hypothetical protein